MDQVLGLGPGAIALLVCVALAAGAVGAIAGMGSGLLMTLFITPIIGPKAVIPVISAMMLITNASRVWVFRHDLVGPKIWLIAGVAVPASWIGALFYVRLEGDVIQVLLGLVLILSIPLRRWMEKKKIAPRRSHIVATSGLFGFLSSLIVGAGILVIPMLMGLGLAGPALIATDAAISVLVNLAKVVFFGSLDAMTFQLFVLALTLGMIAVPGTWAGAWFVRRTSVRLHTWLIEGLIVVGGVSLALSALLN